MQRPPLPRRRSPRRRPQPRADLSRIGWFALCTAVLWTRACCVGAVEAATPTAAGNPSAPPPLAASCPARLFMAGSAAGAGYSVDAQLKALTKEGLEPLSAADVTALRMFGVTQPPGTVRFVQSNNSVPVPYRPQFIKRAAMLLGRGVHDSGLAIRRVPVGHPAYPGFGLYATADLPAYLGICAYGGKLIVGDDLRDRLPSGQLNTYIFDMDLGGVSEVDVIIDGNSKPRCIGSFINDHKDILDEPNCDSIEMWCGGGSMANNGLRQPDVAIPAVIMFTTKPIKAGSELYISYGKPFWRGLLADKPHSPLLDRVLRGDEASQRAIFNALRAKFECPAPSIDFGESDDVFKHYKSGIAATGYDFFKVSIANIQALAPVVLSVSTAFDINGVSVPIDKIEEIDSEDVYETFDSEDAAADYLRRLHWIAMDKMVKPGPPLLPPPRPIPLPLPPPRPQPLPLPHPQTVAVPAAAGAAAAGAAAAGEAAGPANGDGFLCYGIFVKYSEAKDKYDTLLAELGEERQGFWTTLAERLKLRSVADGGTGVAGHLHRKLCDRFNLPFVTSRKRAAED